MPLDPNSDTWDEFAAELGRNIQRRRLAMGLSQERVAYEAGLSRYAYQNLEHGRSNRGTSANPSLRNTIAVSQVLAIRLIDLLPPAPDLRLR
jgi:transcriptional regulator with XRE-family HTH domain